jgi:hypothetical protein
MFGTTIEHVLRNYTKEYKKTAGTILSDGSMHSFDKECHIVCPQDLKKNNVAKKLHSKSITTPTYSLFIKLSELLEYYSNNIPTGKCILIHSTTLAETELNCLFQYYKISNNAKIDIGLNLFFESANHASVSSWNQSYQCWQDMQQWELREWFSLFYPLWTTEWINSQHQVVDTWLKLSNVEILTAPKDSFLKIINFCKLTPDGDLAEFVQEWQSKQQYIVDEFYLLDQIIDSTITQQALTWQPINIVSEAIVQQRLRAKGYEIRCDGLNTFPTDSTTLYNLLEKV